MAVKVPCPHCGRSQIAPPGRDGKKVRCASCGERFVLALPRESPQDPPAPETAPPPGEEPAAPTTLVSPPKLPREVTVSRSMLTPVAGLQNAPPDAMICRLVPESLEWVDASAAAREFLGESDGTPLPPSFLDVVHPDDRPLALEEFQRAAEEGERHDIVLRVRPVDGTWHFVRLDAQARYDREGDLHHVRCHFVDVTDRVNEVQALRRRTEQLAEANDQLRLINQRLREAQAQLVQAEKLAALGTLAAGMAHEINNPLAFATSNAAVLERDTAGLLDLLAAYREGHCVIARDSPELAERIDRLEHLVELDYLQEHLVGVARSTRRGLKRVAQIVANLRDFARLDRSLPSELNPNESLDQALALLGEHLTRAHIQVVRDFGEVPPVECAAASVNQVLFHVLMNAVHAVEDGGRDAGTLRVGTRLEGPEVVIEVADDGCGIAPEVLPRIYDPFFTTKPVGRGTGLGLSISHGIVTDHGGRIEAESTPGLGTTIRLRLPVRRPPGA